MRFVTWRTQGRDRRRAPGHRKDDLVSVFPRHGLHRVPVYKGTLDHPQGLVLLKDLALQHGFGAHARFSLKRLLRPILYAPPRCNGVFCRRCRRNARHMALVIDEYGGVDGLVTIEDLSKPSSARSG